MQLERSLITINHLNQTLLLWLISKVDITAKIPPPPRPFSRDRILIESIETEKGIFSADKKVEF
jgi:hypothetical protein